MLKEEGMTKSIHMLKCASEVLDEIFGFGKSVRDVKEIDFDCSSLNIKIKFVHLVKKNEFNISNYMSGHHVKHHYRKQGHKRSFCNILYGSRPYYHYIHHFSMNTSKLHF